MSSFDPREMVRSKDQESVLKHPLKRFEPTLRTSLRVVIPMNLERLKKHKSNIEKYVHIKNWKDLNMEQINASRTVQQLQATIRDLDKLKYQIIEDDLVEFEKLMKPVKENSLKAFQEFSQLQHLISNEVQKSISRNGIKEYNDENARDNDDVDEEDDKNVSEKDPLLYQHHPLEDHVDDDVTFSTGPVSTQIELGDHDVDELKDEIAACQSWDNLRDGLIELNYLVKDFAEIVHHQQEAVDSIEENIESTKENVSTGAKLLAEASKYKAAAIPVAGAIVGGLLGGPIGLLAGFKLAGAAAAVGGGIAGYQGGKYLKKKHDDKVEVELQNLSVNDNDDNLCTRTSS